MNIFSYIYYFNLLNGVKINTIISYFDVLLPITILIYIKLIGTFIYK